MASPRPIRLPLSTQSGLILSKLATTASATIPRLTPFDRGDDIGYVATIQVGTPPRNFSILIDTGSADFWVGGEGCKAEDGGICVRIISSDRGLF